MSIWDSSSVSHILIPRAVEGDFTSLYNTKLRLFPTRIYSFLKPIFLITASACLFKVAFLLSITITAKFNAYYGILPFSFCKTCPCILQINLTHRCISQIRSHLLASNKLLFVKPTNFQLIYIKKKHAAKLIS